MFAQLTSFEAPSVDWWVLAPQMILIGAALAILLITSLAKETVPTWVSTLLTFSAGLASFVVAMGLWYDVQDNGARSTLAGALGLDGFSLFFTVLISIAVMLTTLVGDTYVSRERIAAPEFNALLLSSATGAIVMASANDLIVLFIGLESLSIGLYVMAAMHLRRKVAQEAAMKYFILGAFSSAFLLYGIALVYGATGSTSLIHISEFTSQSSLAFRTMPLEILYVGLALLMVGFAFKIAAAPFHFWAPDVYQGSPSPVAGYMASAAKAAGFAGMLRVFFVGFGGEVEQWTPVFTGLAILTLIVGATMAIIQTDVKRMLAFSSIGHAGYVLVAISSGTADGLAAALFYLFTYTFMVVGSFAVVGLMGWDKGHDIARYEGLAKRRPVLAVAMTVFILGQAGVPFTSGFIAKFYAIQAAVNDELYALAVVAMVTAVVGAFMYLRIVMAMWNRDADTGPRIAISWPVGVGLLATVAVTLIYGFIPQSLIEFARDAVPQLIAAG